MGQANIKHITNSLSGEANPEVSHMLFFLFHESSAKMCCTSQKITPDSVLVTGNTIQASNNCNLLFFNILKLRCQTVAGLFGLCVLFSGTKLSYFSCVLYELNFHSVSDVATSHLSVERIRNSCDAFPSHVKGSLPHVTS